MIIRRSHRLTLSLAAACCVAGGVAASVSAGASAEVAPSTPNHQAPPVTTVPPSPDGGVSMSSPFTAGVPHVPAPVRLAIGPGGETRYVGPEGSIFNGPTDQVDARVDAWWADQMAAGVSPEEADRMLAELTR